MDSFKTGWLLGFLLIFQASLVRCQSYNPKHILICVEIISKGIAEISKEVMSRVKELIECTRFTPQDSLDDLDTPRFRALAGAFLLKLVQGPSCLDTFAEGMSELIEPHKVQFNSQKCAYVSVVPQCWPNKCGKNYISMQNRLRFSNIEKYSTELTSSISCTLTIWEMASSKFLFALSCVAILATTWGHTYNLNQLGVCLQIVAETTSAAAHHVLPLFDDLTQCIEYKNHMGLEKLSFLMFSMVVYNWLQSLALKVNCLWAMDDRLRHILDPHLQRLRQYECMYLGLPSHCIPK